MVVVADTSPATEMHAELLLIDEQAGRQEAARRGLRSPARSPFSMKPIRRARQFRPGGRSTAENQFPCVPGRPLRDYAKAFSLTQVVSPRSPRLIPLA